MGDNTRRGRIPLPSPAMVVACVALAVALSGASYAAVVLPRNSVGPDQLKRNAVTTAKLRNGAVTTAKLRNGAVTDAKIAPEAVTSARLGDRSVTPTKLAESAVTSFALADGVVGPGKLADGAVTSAKIADAAVSRADLAPGLVLPPVVAWSTGSGTTNSTTFVDLPGAAVGVNIPAGLTQARLIIDFSAESVCYGGFEWCSVRILVDGVEAQPPAGGEFAFDSTDLDTKTIGSWEARSMQRTLVVGPGTHVVWVQMRVRGSETFQLDDWILTVQPHLTG